MYLQTDTGCYILLNGKLTLLTTVNNTRVFHVVITGVILVHVLCTCKIKRTGYSSTLACHRHPSWSMVQNFMDIFTNLCCGLENHDFRFEFDLYSHITFSEKKSGKNRWYWARQTGKNHILNNFIPLPSPFCFTFYTQRFHSKLGTIASREEWGMLMQNLVSQ